MAADADDRLSLSEAAYRWLRREIVLCRLQPAERFTEKGLAARSGYGSSPLRSALTRLEQDGLVRTLPRKGYEVTPLTVKSIDDLFEIWEILGPEVVRHGIARATPPQRDEIVRGFELVDELARATPGGDTAIHLVDTLDATFTLLADATRNTYQAKFFRHLSAEMLRVWLVLLTNEPSAAALQPIEFWRHNILVETDGDAIADASRRTITNARLAALRLVARRPEITNGQRRRD